MEHNNKVINNLPVRCLKDPRRWWKSKRVDK